MMQRHKKHYRNVCGQALSHLADVVVERRKCFALVDSSPGSLSLYIPGPEPVPPASVRVPGTGNIQMYMYIPPFLYILH